MKFKIVIILAGLALFLAPQLRAGTLDLIDCGSITTAIAICPSPGSGDTGVTSLSYSDGVTASGYLFSGNTPTNLFLKTSGANETGLGTTVAVDHEIGAAQYVNLDLTSDVSSGGVQLTLESLQVGEDYMICQGNTPGVFGSLDCVTAGSGTLSTTVFVPLTSGTEIVSVTAFEVGGAIGDGNVLISAVATPEPTSLLLLGTGLLGLGGAVRRRLFHS